MVLFSKQDILWRAQCPPQRWPLSWRRPLLWVRSSPPTLLMRATLRLQWQHATQMDTGFSRKKAAFTPAPPPPSGAVYRTTEALKPSSSADQFPLVLNPSTGAVNERECVVMPHSRCLTLHSGLSHLLARLCPLDSCQPLNVKPTQVHSDLLQFSTWNCDDSENMFTPFSLYTMVYVVAIVLFKL